MTKSAVGNKVMPYHECPRFDLCSAPKCPLDTFYKERGPKLKGEEVCKLRKSSRLRIANRYPREATPYGGLTGREYSGSLATGIVKKSLSVVVGT